MKIFMGLNNIASLMRDYKEGFTALGHECFCVSLHESPIVDGPVDMLVPSLVDETLRRIGDFSPEARKIVHKKMVGTAWQKALEADVCFFMWETFNHDASDLAILKNMGKKIIVRLCGSEVRDPHVDAQFAAHYDLQSTDYGLPTDLSVLRHKLHYLRQVEQYADVIIGSSSMALRPFNWRAAFLFSQQGIVRRTKPQRKIPILLHAPSRKSTKGTDIWLAVFDALRAAGLEFGVKLVENIPHADMLREYATADIVCGSLFYGGRATWEALAGGCVHVGVGASDIPPNALQDFMRHLGTLGLPQDEEHLNWLLQIRNNLALNYGSPNVAVTEATVAQTLADLIQDVPRRQAIADAGPIFMDTWFSPERVCRQLLETLFEPDTLERQADLRLPTFFRHHYVPPQDDPERLDAFNISTKLVSHCDWYGKFVPQGDRASLAF